MRLKIEIEMDGAAFEDGPEMEVQRILQGLFGYHLEDLLRPSREYGAPGAGRTLRDTNGNRAGFARVEE
jgi:hypothetical protein